MHVIDKSRKKFNFRWLVMGLLPGLLLSQGALAGQLANTLIDIKLNNVVNTNTPGELSLDRFQASLSNGTPLDEFTPLPTSQMNTTSVISGVLFTQINAGNNYDFIPSVVDPDSQPLFFSVSGLPLWATFNTGNGSLTGTLVNDDVGHYPGIQISTMDSVTSAVLPAFSITVNNVNDAPTISGAPNAVVNQGDSYLFTPFGNDVDGDLLTYFVNNLPSWLSLDVNSGVVSGIPGNADVGVYSNIEIGVSDGTLSESLASFELNVVNINDAPTILGSPVTLIEEDKLYSFIPTGNDIDVGDTLNYTITNRPSWTTFDSATGKLSGVPDNSDVGKHPNIQIEVVDAGALSAQLPPFSITVLNVNDAPTIRGDPPGEIDQDKSYYFLPLAEDIDGDNLSFIIENKPDWANFDATQGLLTGAPGNDDVGDYKGIKISVTDGEETVSLPKFAIKVNNVNDAPEITGTPSPSLDEEQNYFFQPIATDIDKGDELIFSIVNIPAWASFDSLTGILQGTPSLEDSGNYAGIVISVTDGVLSADLPAFSIKVNNVNQKPVISGSPATSILEGENYQFKPSANDPDNEVLIFSISGKPSWLSFDHTTGLLTGSPGNNDVGTSGSIVISVSDSSDSAALPGFSIQVKDVNLDPIISGSPPATINQGETFVFIPNASDPDDDKLTFSISNKPTWAIFDANNGALTGVPGDNDVGAHQGIVISVTDGIVTKSIGPFSIQVNDVNEAPQISGSAFTLVAGSRIRFIPVVSDPDGDELEVNIAQLPTLGELFLEGEDWVYVASEALLGDDSFSLVVSDGNAQSPAAIFTVQILPVEELVSNDVLVEDEAVDDVYVLDVLENDAEQTDEKVTLVASFSLFGEALVDSGMIRLEVTDEQRKFITVNYIIENENGQKAVAQAVLVIQE